MRKPFNKQAMSEWVKEARKKTGLKQFEFAKLINASNSNVYAWESGLYNPLMDKIFDISIASKHPVPDIITEKISEVMNIHELKKDTLKYSVLALPDDFLKYLNKKIVNPSLYDIRLFLQNNLGHRTLSMNPLFNLDDLLIVNVGQNIFDESGFYLIEQDQHLIPVYISIRDDKKIEISIDDLSVKKIIDINKLYIKGKILSYISYNSLL